VSPFCFVEVVDLDYLGREFGVHEVEGPEDPEPAFVPEVQVDPEESEFKVTEGNDPRLPYEHVDAPNEDEIVERPVVREVQ